MMVPQQTEMGMPEEWTPFVQVCSSFKARRLLPNKARGNHKAADTIAISQKVKKPLAAATEKSHRASSCKMQRP